MRKHKKSLSVKDRETVCYMTQFLLKMLMLPCLEHSWVSLGAWQPVSLDQSLSFRPVEGEQLLHLNPEFLTPQQCDFPKCVLDKELPLSGWTAQ